MNSSICLNILYLNARSILPKLIELRPICEAISYDDCIVETWLDSEISDAELYIPGYRVFRHDTQNTQGGLKFIIRNTEVREGIAIVYGN